MSLRYELAKLMVEPLKDDPLVLDIQFEGGADEMLTSLLERPDELQRVFVRSHGTMIRTAAGQREAILRLADYVEELQGAIPPAS